MKNNKTFLMVTVIAVIAIFAALTVVNRGGREQPPKADFATQERLIKPHNLVIGDLNASVTIVEFLDPECEACRAMHPIIKNLMSEYAGKVKLVIRYMPFHGNSKLASVMLEEAREQGKFNEALDLIFAKQPEWANHGQPKPELLPAFFAQVGVDLSKTQASELISKHGWKVDQDQTDGMSAGVRYTPTFFVNGKILNDIGYSPVKQAIEEALSNSK